MDDIVGLRLSQSSQLTTKLHLGKYKWQSANNANINIFSFEMMSLSRQSEKI